MQILLAMKDVDLRGLEPGVQQGVQRGTSIFRVGDGAHDSIGWIGNEIAWFVFTDAHTLSLRPIIADHGYGEALPERAILDIGSG